MFITANGHKFLGKFDLYIMVLIISRSQSFRTEHVIACLSCLCHILSDAFTTCATWGSGITEFPSKTYSPFLFLALSIIDLAFEILHNFSLKFRHICDCEEAGDISGVHVATEDQMANIMTKSLGPKKFVLFQRMIGVHS